MLKKLLACFLLVVSTSIWACGTTAHNYTLYPKFGNASEKEAFLKNHSCSTAMYYKPHRADPIIATALADAIKSNVSSSVINKVLTNHNCVYGARHLESYKVILEFISEEKYSKFCNIKRINNLFIINANGGIVLRNAAGKHGARLAGLANGTYVEVLSESKGWVYVNSYAGKGYVFKKLLKSY